MRKIIALLWVVALTSVGGAALAKDTCEWAQDNECDEPRYGGTGACEDGTDTTDCAGLAIIPDGPNSCRWANDGECDDGSLGGTGLCNPGTDTADCGMGSTTTPTTPTAPATPTAQGDTCEWAQDNECDEPRYGGTGACEDGTDTTDCAGLAIIPDGPNSCRWANDGECDDGTLGGTGLCNPGTDTADCGMGSTTTPTTPTAPATPTAQGDTCEWAQDNECDEPRYGGTGACEDGTDTTDCAGLAIIPDGPNSCRWANDGECDDGSLGGTGLCNPGTDTADCKANAG